MSRFFYFSHPEVQIDPAIPPPLWALSGAGVARARALAMRCKPMRVISSPEPKALTLARMLSDDVEVHPDCGEVDRSATGYVPHDLHEALADALFAHPEQSALGWETAKAARNRMAAAVLSLLQGHIGGDIAMVGHGGVGSLLWMHIAGLAITRRHDQPRQGCFWQAQIDGLILRPVQGWAAFESFVG